MRKKEVKEKRREIRLTAMEDHKLQLRADLYAEGNISRLIRFWINKAPVQYLPRTKTPKDENEN